MKTFIVLLLTGLLVACSQSSNQEQQEMIGGQTDAHGCLVAAGQSYSYLKQQCVQVFNVADIKLPDPANETSAIYVILSEDKTQAEVFATDVAENTILDAVKGGYVSKDNKVRLIKAKKNWKIKIQK